MTEIKKRGRPLSLVADEKTLGQISGLARIQCTQDEAADVMGVCRRTFASFLHDNKKAREVWDAGHNQGKASLRRTQFEMAKTNPTMAIWLGKQYLDQKDQAKIEHGADEAFVRLWEAVSAGTFAKPVLTIEHDDSDGETIN